jgi:3-methyladenine DNA glycosylase AlkC
MTHKRKTYSSRVSIPQELLDRLNRGDENPATLAEWLAVDNESVAAACLPGAGLADAVPVVARVCREVQGSGVMRRLRAIGSALCETLLARDDADAVYEALAAHRSSVVREWAAMTLPANPRLSLEERLRRARRFARDESMGVREIAWLSYRPFVAAEVPRTIALLEPWVRDEDPRVRRCAVESTRPRGVWCTHIPALKAEPQLGLPIVEPVRSDPDRYVQTAVANWLNDASKSEPAWVEALCSRWTRESATGETSWIVNRSLRTVRKWQG